MGIFPQDAGRFFRTNTRNTSQKEYSNSLDAYESRRQQQTTLRTADTLSAKMSSTHYQSRSFSKDTWR